MKADLAVFYTNEKKYFMGGGGVGCIAVMPHPPPQNDIGGKGGILQLFHISLYRRLSTATLQLFKMWKRVHLGLLHSLQEESTLFPQLNRLSGVAREFVAALAAHLMTPLHRLYLNDCQVL